jgi:hypothetical protein
MGTAILFLIGDHEEMRVVPIPHDLAERHEIGFCPNHVCPLPMPNENAISSDCGQRGGVQFERHASSRSFANTVSLFVTVKPSVPHDSERG